MKRCRIIAGQNQRCTRENTMLPAHNSVDNRAQTHRCLQKSTMTAAGTNTTVTTAALPSRPRRLSHHCFFPRALAYAHVDAAREHGGEETRQEEACEQKRLHQHSRAIEVIRNLQRGSGTRTGRQTKRNDGSQLQ